MPGIAAGVASDSEEDYTGRKGKGADEPSSESEDSEAGDEVDAMMDLPTQQTQVKLASKARQSVSAEVFGKYHIKQAFKPQVIPKSNEVKEKIKQRLEQAFMFMALDDNDLKVVIDAMDEKKPQSGEFVIKEGDAGDCLFIVESGQLKCTKVIGGAEKFLKNYNPGDVFGELALLYNAPRAATIQSETDSHLWVLDRNTFNNIVKDASQKKRSKYESFLQTVPILQSMDHYERSKLADAIKETKVSAGEMIIKQGDLGESFYILVDGEAIATLNSDKAKAVMSYKPGDYFGELALLRGEPRAANVIAQKECKLISLDRKSFKRLLGPIDKILQRNMNHYLNYLTK
jgi:cAMP-dependent protein kinase regulator